MFEVPGWDVGATVGGILPSIQSKKSRPKSKLRPSPQIVKTTKKGSHKAPGRAQVPLLLATPKPCDTRMSASPAAMDVAKATTGSLVNPVSGSSKKILKLSGSRFRYLNQKLYESTSQEALDYFSQNQDDFSRYHEGFRAQTLSWPKNPVDIFY